MRKVRHDKGLLIIQIVMEGEMLFISLMDLTTTLGLSLLLVVIECVLLLLTGPKVFRIIANTLTHYRGAVVRQRKRVARIHEASRP